MSRRLWLAMFLQVLGCGPSLGSISHVWVDRPEVVTLSNEAALPAGLGRSDTDRVLVAQAATDLACSSERLQVSIPAADQGGNAYVVRGCGKQAEYLMVSWYEIGSGLLVVCRFLNLHGDLKAQMATIFKARAERRADFFRSEPGGEEFLVEQWGLLLARATKDLHCPLADTTVGFHHAEGRLEWPVADGCGHRAVYLPTWAPFRVRSIEPLPENAEGASSTTTPEDMTEAHECR